MQVNWRSALAIGLREMKEDDRSHFLVYRVLGIGNKEGRLIDQYQNTGRFLYRYAGSFLEAATKVCFSTAFPGSGSKKVPNTQGQRPRTFEIDCLVGGDAIEIKWRDATTDGDHITKEAYQNQGNRRFWLHTHSNNVLLPKSKASYENSTDSANVVSRYRRRILLWRFCLAVRERTNKHRLTADFGELGSTK